MDELKNPARREGGTPLEGEERRGTKAKKKKKNGLLRKTVLRPIRRKSRPIR